MKKWLTAIFAVILCIVAVFSVADTVEKPHKTNFDQAQIEQHIAKLVENGPRSIADTKEHQLALDYITEQLAGWGFVNEDTVDAPAYLVQDFVAEDTDYQNWYLKNIIVHIPANSANPTNEALMFMGHTDSVPMGDGASDDGLACAVMLEAIDYYMEKMEQGYEISNDLVFCFVDGEEYGLYGSYAFMNEFNGFDNLVERIRFGVNLESRGTSGTLIMFETAKNNYNTIKMFSEINDNVFTCSIATMIYGMMPNGTDFSNYKDHYQGLNFANISGGMDYHTQNDNLENVAGTAHLTQQAMVVDLIIDKLANYDLNSLYGAKESAIFFSYLNLMTVVYNHATAIVLAIIALVLLIANIVLRKCYRKEKGFKKTALSIVSIVIGLLLSAAVVFVCYYLFQYIAVLAGTIDIHAVGTINAAGTAIVIGIGVVVLAITTWVSHFACKLFKIETRDITRAFAYIHALLGIVLSFVLADASYLFVISGILFLVNELIITLVKKIDASKFHGELLVTAIYLPIVMPVLVLATTALGLTMAYIFGILFATTVFAVGSALAPVLKGKKTVPILAVGLVIFLAVSLSHPNANVNLQGKQGLSKLPFDDALIYVMDDDGTCQYRVYDLNAYSALEKYTPKMEYVEDHYAHEAPANLVDEQIRSSAEGNTLTIQKSQEENQIYLTFTNMEGTGFKIDDGITSKTYLYEEGLSSDGSYGITIHSDCVITLLDGCAQVEYQEVFRDYPMCIPDTYTAEEKLHFNLWLTAEYSLGK